MASCSYQRCWMLETSDWKTSQHWKKFRNERTGCSTMCWSHVFGPYHYADCYFGSRGGHPAQADYTDQFADKVVQVIGPAVSARMLAMLRATEAKKVKTAPGTSA